MRVAVVGAGIMGACTARTLAERGHDVTLFEQYELNHAQGSSHGRSRIIRRAYPDAFYTAIMEEGYGMWAELQQHSAEPFVFEPGLLYFGSFESENLREVLRGLQQLEVAHDVLDSDQMKRVFPRLETEPGEIGIFTPEAGWVNAETAVRTCVERTIALGGTFKQGISVALEDLELGFDRFVICAGAWITKFVPVPVRSTLQTFAYVSQVGGPVQGPVWIEDGEQLFYGFPSEPGAKNFKIGIHEQGPLVDPCEEDRTPTLPHMQAIIDEAERRFRAEGAGFEFTGCLYTSTADEDFLLGRVGDTGYFASPCSGHGFKFGPWIGKTMADFVEEKDAPENHPRLCWPKVKLEA